MLPLDLKKYWKVPIITLIYGVLIVGTRGCNPGFNSGGWMHPPNDQYILEGKPYEMYCILNETRTIYPNATSKDLRFYVDGKPFTGQVSVYNETAIKMTVDRATIAEHNTYHSVACKLLDKGLCTRYIYVGYEPQPVSNFSCISQNWENLTCTWDEPFNPIPTEYTLYYVPVGTRSKYNCPSEERKNGSCTWRRNSSQIYRSSVEQLKFVMQYSNSLSGVKKLIQNLDVIYQHSFVLPSKMENLTLVSVTKSSAAIHWKIPDSLIDFPPGLLYKISFRPLTTWTTTGETFVDTRSINNKSEKVDFLLKDLPFAGVAYEIKVYAKSAVAAELWSEPAILQVKTSPDYPCAAPRTLDSFEIIRSELIVYWNPLHMECRNGDQFRYEVTVLSDGTEETRLVIDGNQSYVNLRRVSLEQEHFVRILAVNELGPARVDSTVYLPSYGQLLAKPRDVTTVTYSDYHVEVLWKPPKETTRNAKASYYTVFWCVGKISGGVCNGDLNWSEMKDGTFGYNITLPVSEDKKDIIVFVAARSGNATSGMERSTCDIRPTFGIDTVNDVAISAETSNSVSVKWTQIECEQRVGLILAYRIYYCALDSNDICKGPVMNITVDSSDTSAILKNLEAFTTYSIRMVVVSRLGEGNASQQVKATTLTARPSAPTGVRITNVTNSSFGVQWLPPSHPNGILDTYRISYGSDSDSISISADQNQVTVTDVLSYKQYAVKVRACHADLTCSDYSESVSILTEIGAPGSVRNLRIIVDDAKANISWTRPDNMGGPATRFMIKVDALNYTATISAENGETFSELLPVLDCGESGKLEALVAAFNEAENQNIFGPWESEEAFCYAPGLSLQALLGVIFTVLIVAVVLIVAAVHFYWYMQKKTITRRLKPLLPWERQTAGISKPEEKRTNPKNISNVYSVKPNNYDRLTSVSSATVPAAPVPEPPELTVIKAAANERHGRSSSGDSSGCSSGHESLSSHDTGGNRESYANDSGTEMEPSSPTPDVFPEYGVESIKVDVAPKGSSSSIHYTKHPVNPILDPSSPNTLASFSMESINSSQTPEPYVKVGMDPATTSCRDGYVTLGLNDNRANHTPSASPCLSTASIESSHSDRQLLPSKYSGSRPSLVPKIADSSLRTLVSQDHSDSEESEKEDTVVVPESQYSETVPAVGYVTADVMKLNTPKTVSGYVTLGGVDGATTEGNPALSSNSHYVALGLNHLNS